MHGCKFVQQYIRSACLGILLLLNTHISCKIIMGFALSLLYTVQKIYSTSSTLPFKNLIKHLSFHILLKTFILLQSPDYAMIIRRNRLHPRLVCLSMNNLSDNI